VVLGVRKKDTNEEGKQQVSEVSAVTHKNQFSSSLT
jgi:hypothetical protein